MRSASYTNAELEEAGLTLAPVLNLLKNDIVPAVFQDKLAEGLPHSAATAISSKIYILFDSHACATIPQIRFPQQYDRLILCESSNFEEWSWTANVVKWVWGPRRSWIIWKPSRGNLYGLVRIPRYTYMYICIYRNTVPRLVRKNTEQLVREDGRRVREKELVSRQAGSSRSVWGKLRSKYGVTILQL